MPKCIFAMEREISPDDGQAKALVAGFEDYTRYGGFLLTGRDIKDIAAVSTNLYPRTSDGTETNGYAIDILLGKCLSPELQLYLRRYPFILGDNSESNRESITLASNINEVIKYGWLADPNLFIMSNLSPEIQNLVVEVQRQRTNNLTPTDKRELEKLRIATARD